MKLAIIDFFLFALLGWVLGILVNYLADILPIYRRLVKPICLNCQQKIQTPIKPLFQFIIWPKVCSLCGVRRSKRNFVIEIFFILLSIYLWQNPHPALGIAISITLMFYFTLVVVIDLEYRLILHPISILGGIIGLLTGSYLHGLATTILGGIAGYFILFGIYLLGVGFVKIISRWRGPIDEVALGYGDVNLGGVIGLLLGWPGIIGGIMITILLAGIVSLVYLVVMIILGKYRPNLVLPFGPYLIGSTIILLFLKDLIS